MSTVLFATDANSHRITLNAPPLNILDMAMLEELRVDEPPIRLTQSLARMGKAAQNQLKQVLDAFTSRNAEEAEAVWNRDGEIDEIYNSLFRELLTYMMEDPRTIGLCTHLLFVAKNIERSGDHCTNIAEVVYHMVRAGHLANNRPKADTTSETSVPYETHA